MLVHTANFLHGANANDKISYAVGQVQMVEHLLDEVLLHAEVAKELLCTFDQPEAHDFVDVTAKSRVQVLLNFRVFDCAAKE